MRAKKHGRCHVANHFQVMANSMKHHSPALPSLDLNEGHPDLLHKGNLDKKKTYLNKYMRNIEGLKDEGKKNMRDVLLLTVSK